MHLEASTVLFCKMEYLCRICKPGDKLHVVWVTTTGADDSDATLQTYKDAMHEAKVPASWQS